MPEKRLCCGSDFGYFPRIDSNAVRLTTKAKVLIGLALCGLAVEWHEILLPEPTGFTVRQLDFDPAEEGALLLHDRAFPHCRAHLFRLQIGGDGEERRLRDHEDRVGFAQTLVLQMGPLREVGEDAAEEGEGEKVAGKATGSTEVEREDGEEENDAERPNSL